MTDRDLDLVLFGATGFTGGLTAEDLTRQTSGAPVRWAIAGRDRARLDATRDRLVGIDAAGAPSEVIVVDATDRAGLTDLARRSAVVATTVGPFDRLGEDLVAACVGAGTDYVDITGEPAFVGRLIERYHDQARDAGIRIVPCCGFDSIPHDLGAQLAVAQLPDDAEITLRGYVSAGGRASGGTLASAIDALGDPSSMSLPRTAPRDGRRLASLPRTVHRRAEIDGWAVPFPSIDPQIVLRSAALGDGYGRTFRYGHFIRAGALPVAGAIVAGAAVTIGLAQLAGGRRLLHRFAPDPGQGPDEATRAKGWFRVTLLGEGGGGQVRVEVRGGDPGYGETSKMLAESALTLLRDRDRLPDVTGVVTPASGLGIALRTRLQTRGMSFETVTS